MKRAGLFIVVVLLIVGGVAVGWRYNQSSTSKTDNGSSAIGSTDGGNGSEVTTPEEAPRLEIPETQRLASAGVDDPTTDGWTSEAFAAQAKKTVQKLLKQVASGAQLDSDALYITDAQVALPHSLKTAFESNHVQVRRSAAQDLNTVEIEPGLKQLLAPLSRVGDPHVHVKVVAVAIDKSVPTTTCLVETDAMDQQRQVQQTFKLECDWGTDFEHPRLASMTVVDFEEIQRNAGPWFVDCTATALQSTTLLQQQLGYSMNHWMERIERAHGMDDSVRTGLALGDCNGDDLADLYVCQGPGLPNLLLLQQADGTVVERSAQCGANFLDHTSSALFLDLDNDGDQDLVVGTTAGVLVLENVGLRRDGEQAIPNYQQRAKLAEEMTDVQSLAAADYDEDGDLDVFVCAYRHQSGRIRGEFVFHDATTGGRNYLWRNEGNLKFSDATSEAGLDVGSTRYTLAASWEDYDNDGDPDLYVANDYGRNYLFRNDEGRFTDVTENTGLSDTGFGMSVSWGDANRDGNMDLYIGNMFSSAGSRITTQSKFQQNASTEKRALYQRMARGNSLFANGLGGLGNQFEDVTSAAAVGMGRWAWSSVFADINNDGWEDLVVANGYITADDDGDL